MEITVIDQFKQWLIEDGKATSTVESYMNDVQRFNRYLVEHAAPELLLSRFYFTSYLKQQEKQEMKVNAINEKVTSLKVYNDWLNRQGYVTDMLLML